MKNVMKSYGCLQRIYLFVCIFLCISVRAEAVVGNRQAYINPILSGDYPDPTVVRVGTDYYMTHSSFLRRPGLTVLHSTDLLHWQPIGYALSRHLGSIWAPDICCHQGVYYIYFTVSQGNDNFSTYVVTSTNPKGAWSDPIDLNIDRWIDPCHVVDKNTGERWLFLSGGHRIRLSLDGLSTVGELEKVYEGWDYPNEWITEGKALEGPKIKQIGDYYYWLSAQGGTAGAPTSHMIVVARSVSLDGPWVNAPNNPLVHTYSGREKWWSKGHGSLIDTPDENWYVVYHAYEKGFLNNGRQTLMEAVTINEEGWLEVPVRDNTDQPLLAPMNLGGVHSLETRLKDFRIGLDWMFFEDYSPERCVAREGRLEMKGQGKDMRDSAPLLFPTGAHRYEITVQVSLRGCATAGIVLFYNKDFFVGFGGDSTYLYRWRRGVKRRIHSSQGAQLLWLKLCVDQNVVSGSYSLDGRQWSKGDFGMEVSGYHHNTLGGFLSLMPGLFVYGDGEAVFSDFSYAARL